MKTLSHYIRCHMLHQEMMNCGVQFKHKPRIKKAINVPVLVRDGDLAPPFLTLALSGGEWSALYPSRFTLVETSPGIHCTGGWMGPRASLDDVEKKQNLARAENRTSNIICIRLRFLPSTAFTIHDSLII
jgi:hypothetical protein